MEISTSTCSYKSEKRFRTEIYSVSLIEPHRGENSYDTERQHTSEFAFKVPKNKKRREGSTVITHSDNGAGLPSDLK